MSNPILAGLDRSLLGYLGHFRNCLAAGHNNGPVQGPSLDAKADRMESMRQQREGLVPMTPMDSGGFFQRILQQGGGATIPLK